MKILITESLSPEGMAIIKKEKDIQVEERIGLSKGELLKIIPRYDALIVRSQTKVTGEVIERASRLKVIGRPGVGLDNVDVEAATKRGIIVMNTPEGNTISTAELTFGLLLSIARNIPSAVNSVKMRKWERGRFVGRELYNKTLGIIGLGRIGAEVARRALSFGMRILVYDPYVSSERAKKMEVQLVELKELLSRSDYIT
ncbi:MAG: phosphoglycerate dehydrogenase, partial [Candidatus Omnitrophica bacterium]|nr:phosphoglycerate dehydrogenase [Candidatus Omnitrophota bacterium]